MFGGRKNKRGGKLGRPSTLGPGSDNNNNIHSNEHYRSNPPPAPAPPQPPGMPIPIGETIPWLLISAASYAAFLYLPGRVQSPRARVTLIGGNEFINVASHLHFCVWAWLVQDFIFRILAILLFPPKRAAAYFLQMFVLPSSSTSSLPSSDPTITSSEVGSSAVLEDISDNNNTSGGFINFIINNFLRPIRSLLVSPAPGQLDYVPQDYKANDFRTHGGVDRGSTYWHYRQVCILSFVFMFLFWAFCTYMYQTRHVLTLLKDKAEAKKKGMEDRKKQSARIKREFRAEVEKKKEQILKARAEGKSVAKEDVEQVEKMLEQLEKGEKNLAEDEFSDEDVDYDPYGRPVPDPPFIPTVSWMVLWSMVFAGCFLWVQAMPILMSQLFPVGVCGALAFCILMPQ